VSVGGEQTANVFMVKKAVEKITGGGLDYLIANAGITAQWARFDSVDVL
jgi:NAD(P)-dependent dehydrogenase (short-subunit alcohol dehydrogenase family)